jgi:ribose-phosphate pyrophosphokinase
MEDFTLFAGTANPALAGAIATELGVRPGACAIEHFPDGETAVRLDEPVRGRDVFVVQPTAPPVNDHLVELLAFADACRRSAAGRITAVVPYFGYARSDKRHGRREPITASLVARLMQTAGIDQVVTLDLHAAQIEGFFHIPVDSLTAVPTLCRALDDRVPPDAVVVSPDTGRVKTATDYAHRLGTSVVVLHKRRASGTETEVTHVVGDVSGRACLIIDDMISTGGTIARAIEALLAAGARPEITVAATHGLFVGAARAKLGHEAVREVLVTDTVPRDDRSWPQLRRVSVAPLLAAAIRRLRADGSLSDLY